MIKVSPIGYRGYNSTDPLGAAHVSLHWLKCDCTTRCQVAGDESSRNQLASLTTANQWNLANLEGKLRRKTLTAVLEAVSILVLIFIKI